MRCPAWWDSTESFLAAPSNAVGLPMSWANRHGYMAVIDLENTKGNFAVKFSQCYVKNKITKNRKCAWVS